MSRSNNWQKKHEEPFLACDSHIRISSRGRLTIIAHDSTTVSPGTQCRLDEGHAEDGKIVAVFTVSAVILTAVSKPFKKAYVDNNQSEYSSHMRSYGA